MGDNSHQMNQMNDADDDEMSADEMNQVAGGAGEMFAAAGAADAQAIMGGYVAQGATEEVNSTEEVNATGGYSAQGGSGDGDGTNRFDGN